MKDYRFFATRGVPPMQDVMLALFKDQIDAECDRIRAEHGLKQSGHGLIWWYFMRLHGFSAAEVAEVFCEGGGDLGIDAIWIDGEGIAHFYQFKHFQRAEKEVPAGEIDRLISGIRLIVERRHEEIANPDVIGLISEVYQRCPTGYRIHVVTSGRGVPHEARVKLTALVTSLNDRLFSFTVESLDDLHQRFYARTLPVVDQPIVITLESAPYTVRSGDADCLFFSVPATFLARLYEQHKEQLLQRNIRVEQGTTATNRSIEETCSSDSSVNFVHYNNGVTFLCRTAEYDYIGRTIRMTGTQVVNGGQTIRAIHRMSVGGTLRDNAIVPARAISGSDDKDFANEVAVNQNNQNRMKSGFLRSTDYRVIQLGNTLASRGWYLERREREVASFTEEEVLGAEQRIGRRLQGHVIPLKDGLQAYTATFFGQPEIAKKNPGQMFLSAEDGGHFEAIFAELDASKVIAAYRTKCIVDDFLARFASRKRRKDRVSDWREDYRQLLGDELVDEFSEVVDQMLPQCGIFLCGTLYQHVVAIGEDRLKLPELVEAEGDQLLAAHALGILRFARKNPDVANKAWPVLLKSQTFFTLFVVTYRASFE